jgi:hypothetical protein
LRELAAELGAGCFIAASSTSKQPTHIHHQCVVVLIISNMGADFKDAKKLLQQALLHQSFGRTKHQL